MDNITYRQVAKCGKTLVRDRTESHQTALLDDSHSIRWNTVMAKRQSRKLSDQIRRAMDDSGLTRYRIAQDTGINEAALGKFYHGERGLSLASLDMLGEYLSLRIVMDRRPKKKGK